MSPEGDGGKPQKKGGGALKWLAVGCLVAIVAIGGCAYGLYALGRAAMEMKDETRTAAVDKITKHDEVLSKLGQPLDFGMVNQINIDNNVVNLSLPVSGPQGKGTVAVSATKTPTGLRLDSVTVTIEGTNEVITIVAGAPEKPGT